MNFFGKTTFLSLIMVFTALQSMTVMAQVNEPNKDEERPAVDGWVKMTREEYIVKWRHLALENMEVYGIPASVTLGQAILESGYGNGYLARAANNHFCIQCKSTWTGGKIYHDDDEEDVCFRVYDSVEDSFRDHGNFLSVNKRYDSLFDLDMDDYKGWARGLKAAGYATAKDYADRLIRVIEQTHIYLLDRPNGIALYDEYMSKQMGLSPSDIARKVDPYTSAHSATASTERDAQDTNDASVGAGRDMTTAYADGNIDPNNFRVTINAHKGYDVFLTNGAHYIIARSGDTYESLGRLFEVPSKTLRRFNDVSSGALLAEGDIVYIDRKMARWDGENMVHTVTAGQTLHIISQIYGVRIDQLAKMNRIRPYDPLVEGQTIKLR